MKLERTSRRNALRLISLGAGSVLVSAACAPAAPAAAPASAPTSAPAAPAAAAAVATTAPAAVAQPAAKPAVALTEVVIANESEPADLLPFANGFGGWLVDRQIYEVLAENRTVIKPDGSVETTWVPRLATSWERVDPLRWRFHLRENVLFHNGEKFTAQGIKAAYDVLSDRDRAAALKKSAILAQYAGCEVVNDYTVDILTRAPDSEALSYLRIGLVPLPPKQLAEKGLESFRENPVGTGRYRLSSWTRGQQIVLERNADYWGEKAPYQRLRYLARPDAGVRAQTVRSGETLFAYNVGSEQAQGGNVIVGGGFQSSGLRFNNVHAVTGDVRVRKALNHAIDRAGIAKSIFRGTAEPIGFFGFQPVKLTPYTYSLDEARKLISEAGATGKSVDLVYGETRIPEEDQLAEIYKAGFEEAGLKVNLRKVEPVRYSEFSSAKFEEQPPILMETTSSGNYGEIAAGLRDKYGCAGSGTFCNTDLDKDYAVLSNLEGDARLSKLQQIADRLHTQEVSRAWVVAVRQVHLGGPNVKASLPANGYMLLDDLQFA